MNAELAVIFSGLAAASSIIALIKFWMDMGETKSKANSAAAATAMLSGKLEMLSSNLAEHKVESARTFATRAELTEAERAIALGLNNSVQGIYDRLDKLASRLDSLIDLGKHRE